MKEATALSDDHQLRLELINLTKRLAPEKLGAVIESLAPVGLSDIMRFNQPTFIRPEKPRLKGKELLEQALSIFK